MLSSSASSRSGFSMKSKAPAFTAAIASCTVPCPVMNITGMRQPRTLMRCWSSSPLICGICTSSNRQPPRRGSYSSRNERADGNASTEYPAARSINLSPCLTAASSSTTKTVLSGIGARFGLGTGQIKAEDPADTNATRHSQAAAVRLDDRAADREPHPHAVRFGGYERLEDRVRHLGGYPWPRIGHGDLDGAVAFAAGLDDDQSPLGACRFHRVHCVPQQVQQHLLDLDPVSHNRRQARIDPCFDLDLLLHCLHVHQAQSSVDQRRNHG